MTYVLKFILLVIIIRRFLERESDGTESHRVGIARRAVRGAWTISQGARIAAILVRIVQVWRRGQVPPTGRGRNFVNFNQTEPNIMTTILFTT